jgi:4-amino-4-deoxy-L-arabinose transferase-like glycosyltransferase
VKAGRVAAIALIAALSGLAGWHASQKPFWFDEILTLRIAEQPLGEPMWRAMTAGFEYNPPLAYVAVRGAEKALGRGRVTSRLPFLLAGALLLLLIYGIARREYGDTAALGAIVAFALTGAYPYFYEARGYVFVLAGTALAWYCWQPREGATRTWWQELGIAAGLSVAMLAHMWAIVVPPCFAVAWWWQCLKQQRYEWRTLAAILAPLGWALLYVPLAASTQGITFNNPVYHSSLRFAYVLTLWGGQAALLGGLFLLFAGKWRNPDFVLATLLLLAPAGIYAVTVAAHKPFMQRYALVASLSLIWFAPPIAAWLLRQNKWLQGLTAAALALFLAGHVRGTIGAYFLDNGAHSRVPGKEPIVFAGGLEFLTADFTAPPALRQRLVYVADPEMAIARTGSDGVDAALLAGEKHLGLEGRLLSYRQYRQLDGQHYFIDSGGPLVWLPEELLAAGKIRERKPGEAVLISAGAASATDLQ